MPIKIYLSENRIDTEILTLSRIHEIKNKNVIFTKLSNQKIVMEDVLQFLEEEVEIKSQGNEKIIQFKFKNFLKQKIYKYINHQLDEIVQKNFADSIRILGQIFSKDPTETEILQEEKILKRITEKQDHPQKILLQLKKAFTLKQKKSAITLAEKSSDKSKLSMKILLTGFLNNQCNFTEVIDKADWNSLEDNRIRRNEFLQWYMNKICQEYKLSKNSIIISEIKLSQKTIDVKWTTTQIDKIVKSELHQQKLKIHPFFQSFTLSVQDFDPSYNKDFSQNQGIDFRGGWPYFPPRNCKRYGLKVQNLYDDKNNDWLKMGGNSKEWVIAYHGVRSPYQICNNGKKVFESILEGIQKGQMLMAGSGQGYIDHFCLNKPEQKVGRGIYCSPHMSIAIGYTSSSQYRLILQCRIKPEAIKVCENHQFWVINNSRDIRPYGVILMENNIAQNYPSAQKQYPEQYFTWEKYKDKINKQ